MAWRPATISLIRDAGTSIALASQTPLRAIPGLQPARPMDAIGAAAAFADRLDRLLLDELGQIAPGRGAAHLGQADGLAQGHAAREPLRFGIQQAIEQFLLAAVETAVAVAPPERRLAPHRNDHGAIGGRRCRQLLQEPAQPACDIQISPLAALQCRVIALPLPQDLGGDAQGGKQSIGDGTGEATVAVFIGVEGEKPEVGQARAQQSVQLWWRGGDPIQEGLQLLQAIPAAGAITGERMRGSGPGGDGHQDRIARHQREANAANQRGASVRLSNRVRPVGRELYERQTPRYGVGDALGCMAANNTWPMPDTSSLVHEPVDPAQN